MALTRFSQAQLIELFGDYRPFLDQGGHISRAWEAQILTVIPLPGPLPLSWNHKLLARTTKVHRLVAPHLSGALGAIFNRPRAWATINDYGGCYMFRANSKNPKELSTHSWGIGPDMDVLDNPQGHAPHVDDEVREIMESFGFLWGGTFKGDAIDGMHWQFADPARLG